VKAYVVAEPFEGLSIVIFAKSNVVARREGANELGIEFNEVDYCHRAPGLDGYFPGPIPRKVLMYDLNWWLECYCCDAHLGSEDNPLWVDGNPYCPTVCGPDYPSFWRRLKARLFASLSGSKEKP